MQNFLKKLVRPSQTAELWQTVCQLWQTVHQVPSDTCTKLGMAGIDWGWLCPSGAGEYQLTQEVLWWAWGWAQAQSGEYAGSIAGSVG